MVHEVKTLVEIPTKMNVRIQAHTSSTMVESKGTMRERKLYVNDSILNKFIKFSVSYIQKE